MAVGPRNPFSSCIITIAMIRTPKSQFIDQDQFTVAVGFEIEIGVRVIAMVMISDEKGLRGPTAIKMQMNQL